METRFPYRCFSGSALLLMASDFAKNARHGRRNMQPHPADIWIYIAPKNGIEMASAVPLRFCYEDIRQRLSAVPKSNGEALLN